MARRPLQETPLPPEALSPPVGPRGEDASLIRELLALTPRERLVRHQQALRRVHALRRAFERSRGR